MYKFQQQSVSTYPKQQSLPQYLLQHIKPSGTIRRAQGRLTRAPCLHGVLSRQCGRWKRPFLFWGWPIFKGENVSCRESSSSLSTSDLKTWRRWKLGWLVWYPTGFFLGLWWLASDLTKENYLTSEGFLKKHSPKNSWFLLYMIITQYLGMTRNAQQMKTDTIHLRSKQPRKTSCAAGDHL